METIAMNIEPLQDDSSDEEISTDLIQNEAIDINSFDSLQNDYLLVGIYGNGSAFLKASLYLDIKRNSNALKVKFMSKSNHLTQSKIVVAEVYQFECKGVYHLALYTKNLISQQNFKFLMDYLENCKVTFKRIVCFDSTHFSNFLSEDKTDSGPLVFALKNKFQLRSNQMIKAPDYPSPNTLQDFSAYILTLADFKDIPCVVYILVSDVYEVSLNSIRGYIPALLPYAILREKLTEKYFSDNQVDVNSIKYFFTEYNLNKNLLYS